MKYFFVIGGNTSQSLSPLIFNHWFRKYKINAKYSYIEVKEKNFEKKILQIFKEKTITGFNITIPYKKEIFKFLDISDLHAKKIQAVNCVTLGKKNKGINTDWIGYKNSIKTLKIGKKSNIIILGYGGAAQAIAYSFVFQGFKNITIFNRTKKLIQLGSKKHYTKKYSLITKYIKKTDLLINTTPLNPLSKTQSKMVSCKTVVSEIVYKPKNTLFLKQFKLNPKIYGISMLLEQATLCFYAWFGFKPILDRGLLEKINKKIK